jgi:hypothetical protein
MMGRRTAAMLCVLLLHALLSLGFFKSLQFEDRRFRPPSLAVEAAPMELILLEPKPAELERLREPKDVTPPDLRAALPSEPRESSPTPPTGAITAPDARPFVDWPVEARESAERVLAAEREAERLARMFAGPDGTWASLTKRQRSQLNKFKWAPGVDGLKYDDKGNAIYTLPSGCTIVNFMFFGCPLGKPKVHDDMFDNMRLYFDEQRLPELKDGNGTEPEALRPAN